MSDQLPVIRRRDPGGFWGVYLGSTEGGRRLGSYLDADGFVPSPQRPDLRPERASRHIHDPVERWAIVRQAVEDQRPGAAGAGAGDA